MARTRKTARKVQRANDGRNLASQEIHQQRYSYADHFVKRCKELTMLEDLPKKKDNLPPEQDIFLCTFIHRPARYRCSACGIEFDNLSPQNDEGRHQHPPSKEEFDQAPPQCDGKPEFISLIAEKEKKHWTKLAPQPGEDMKIGPRLPPHLNATGMTNHFLECCLTPSVRGSEKSMALIQMIDQGGKPLVYTKQNVWNYNPGYPWPDLGVQLTFRAFFDCPPIFCKIPARGLNPSIIGDESNNKLNMVQHGGTNADVWTVECPKLASTIKPSLDRQGQLTNDRPIPRYHNIIDPNLFVRDQKPENLKVWVPSEFDVSEDGQSVELVGGDRAHWMDCDLIRDTAAPVLQAALPLLAKLRRPTLLLEGQRLQVVVKAQRIELPPSRKCDKGGNSEQDQSKTDAPDLEGRESDDVDESEYIGLWHIDGEHEPVVAVILFYYHVDEALVGGKMEFLDRSPMVVLSDNDAEDFGSSFPAFQREKIRQRLRPPPGHNPDIVNATVPVKSGTLLVFSNYQMVHRVLRMVNQSTERSASREFVALFLLDPSAQPMVPARCHLANTYLYERALTGEITAAGSGGASTKRKADGTATSESTSSLHLPKGAVRLIMEFMGQIPSNEIRSMIRNRLLHSQLQPSGKISGSETRVYTTGNGCFTMIGWLDNLLGLDSYVYYEYFNRPNRRALAMNDPPEQLDRGLSETLSIPSETSSLE